MKRIKDRPWFNYTVAACIAVVLYVVLTHLSGVLGGFRTFLGYFKPVILACIIAYIINPLSRMYRRSVFRRIKKDRPRERASDILAFVTVILFLSFLMLLLIPQLIDGVRLFVANLDGYVATANAMLERLGVSASTFNLDGLIDSSEALLQTLTGYIKNNINLILSRSVDAGRIVLQILIAFLLSIYLLAAKHRLKNGGEHLLKAALNDKRYERLSDFLARCHKILNRFIAFNLIDSLIIGAANAIFMAVLGMPYIGLVSFVAAVTNLVPTFGPIVGAGIGVFVLLLVEPWYALAFIIFTVVLQLLDAYLIKPKLFGDSLGVPPLLILVGVIVGGRMFGIVGILLAIPGVAILDMLYRDYFMTWLEKRKAQGKTA